MNDPRTATSIPEHTPPVPATSATDAARRAALAAASQPNIEQVGPVYCPVCRANTYPFTETAPSGHGEVVRCATCFNQIVPHKPIAPPAAEHAPPVDSEYQAFLDWKRSQSAPHLSPAPVVPGPRRLALRIPAAPAPQMTTENNLLAVAMARLAAVDSELAALRAERDAIASMLDAAGYT